MAKFGIALSTVLTRGLALILGACALGFLVGGCWLVSLGGSPYYGGAGLLLSASAVGIWMRRRSGLWAYGAIVVATTIWALWEGGLNPWALLPRLGLLLVLGIPLLLPVVRGCLDGGPQWPTPVKLIAMAVSIVTPVAAIAAALLLGHFSEGDSQTLGFNTDNHALASVGAGDDWPVIGAASGGTRYSGLTGISPDNVGQLRVAWSYKFGDAVPSGLQVTPIKIGHALYACNSRNVVVSLDPDTGRERWRFDPKVDLDNAPFPVCRGVAFYQVPDATGPCARRIYTNTVDARLFAIDAETGRLCQAFGNNGQVSLLEGMGDVPHGYYYPSSAPTIARGRIVLGGMVPDGQYWGEPSGVIRAFDAVSGKLAWAYDVGRPDRTGMPPKGETYTRATPNSWAPMSYDDALGLIYVPTGVATPDHYGVRRRPLDEQIGSSVMALDVETGRRRWVFQTVHHDLWDYDVASQPVLVDIPTPGGITRALLQATKRGEVFFLDRATGRPLDKVEERPVPQRGRPPEERLSPTQPFPTRIPPLDGGLLNESQMWGLSPFDQMWCRIKFRQARYDGPMTPLGTTPSIMYPGYLGGMDWGGLSFDGARGIVIAPTNHVANFMQLIPRKDADALGVNIFGSKVKGGDFNAVMNIAVHAGLPYAASKAPFLSPLQVPCQQPPWSRLTAVDLASGRVLWSKPLGTGKANGPFGIASHMPLPMGVPAIGNTLVTRSGLTFIGASTDRTFRAFETRSGRQLWQAALPESGNAGPMTYRSSQGRQFIVMAAGGHKLLRGRDGDNIVAFALPSPAH
jgi:quinoprotein glucose dehydrogenase